MDSYNEHVFKYLYFAKTKKPKINNFVIYDDKKLN